MIKLSFNYQPLARDDRVEDVHRLVAIFAKRGFTVAAADMALAWEVYSENLYAGWIILPPSDQSCFDHVREHLTE